MGNMAIALEQRSVIQECGRVVEAGERPTVATAAGTHRARRAASCLLEPAAGDKVLVAIEPGGACYLLAVLERAESAEARLALHGDAVLSAGGRLRVEGRDGVAIESPAEVAVTSAQLQVNALRGDLSVQHLSFVGSLLQANVERIKLLARSLDSVLERLYQTVTRSHRRVEEVDDLRAGQIDHRARDSLSLHGGYTMLTAKSVVKVDGEQIHLG